VAGGKPESKLTPPPIHALRGIPDDKEFLSQLAHSIGFLALQFGLFEFSLNGGITIIHEYVGQPIKDGGSLPYNLGDRLRYLNRAMKTFSPLAPFAEEGLFLVGLARLLVKTRNGVLHSYPADYEEATETLTFLSMRPDSPDNTMHRENRFIISLSALAQHGTKAEVLAGRMGDLSHRLFDALAASSDF